MIIPHETKNTVISSFNNVVYSDFVPEMARTVSNICFRLGYRVVPFKKKDDPMKSLIESSDLTIEHVQKKLKALNPDRKRPVKSVTIPLVDLRTGKVNVGLTFTIEDCLNGKHLRCKAFMIVTDLSGLSACG